MNQAEKEPLLEAPGAGIPQWQQFFLRTVVRPFVAAKSDWDKDSALFNALTQKILAAAGSADVSKLEKRILVPRLQGLEDSSRYWSVAMTLDHLTIVGKSISAVVIDLSKGDVPDFKVSMAAVKPPVGKPYAESLHEYEAFAKNAIADIDAKIGDRKSAVTLHHPWFGPFTAHQWHWLLAMHQNIHLRQIREILKRV